MLLGGALLLGVACAAGARAQDERKLEVGAQFSVLDATNGRASVVTILPCTTPPCPTQTSTTDGRSTEPGFGGRVGYNVTPNVALEAEVNFFPRERDFTDDKFNGGRKLQGLFGVKAGKRFDAVGLFAKARPGFVRFAEGDLRPRAGGGCIAIVPPPVGCFEGAPRTDFAFDVGGVVELYPSARTVVRFDAGDTILRTDAHLVPINLPTRTAVVTSRRDTTHNFQGSLGVAFRF
jgi:hypothetical protein